MPKLVDSLEIFREHIWMLVIFVGDVLLDRVAKRDIVRSPEWQM